jgi:hypothetical protein
VMIFVRNALVGLSLGMFGCSAAYAANSCANLDAFSAYDQPPLRETSFGVGGVGTFRIAGETDENKQPNFNLAFIDCESETDDRGRATGLSCKITKAVTWANDAKPDGDKPNCSLDLDTASYPMKELSMGVLTGIEEGTGYFNSLLTIDRNAKRIYLSFTRTKYAENFDKIKSETCSALPLTEVLMNCTAWARNRNQSAGPGRYCDFGGVGDK